VVAAAAATAEDNRARAARVVAAEAAGLTGPDLVSAAAGGTYGNPVRGGVRVEDKGSVNQHACANPNPKP